jgi:class II lanthipeptide synthase
MAKLPAWIEPEFRLSAFRNIRSVLLITISDEEFIAIVEAAASPDDFPHRRNWSARSIASGVRTSLSLRKGFPQRPRIGDPVWANELREMLVALAKVEFSSRNTSALHKLCECGARYGSQKLEATVSSKLFAMLSQKARAGLENELERRIARVTKPSFTLELNAFRRAFRAIYAQRESEPSEMMQEKFLGRKPCDRLFPMFKGFPVLAKLWSLLISQWIDEVADLLLRFSVDRVALSRSFLGSRSVDKIVDLCSGLSDPHNGGRTVIRLRCEGGSMIYKPRCGHGEQQWFKFIRYLNANALRPDLRAAKVLCREGYCWMEEIRSASCKNRAAARRFYQRLGATIAAVYLLRAVDCHRDNVIASGEYPVLVDAEALWHLPREEQAQSYLKTLFQTGFISASKQRSSLHNRSSVLGSAKSGGHIPRIGDKRVNASKYEREVVTGFRRAWQCIVSSPRRRTEFARRWRRFKRTRRIYWATAKYDQIRRASIQPAVLRSGIDRDLLIANLCSRRTVPQVIVRQEIKALRRVDIPYFTQKRTAWSFSDNRTAPQELIDALRCALHS